MRQARRSLKRPLVLGFCMLTALYFLFGRGGPALYDPAQAALHTRPGEQSGIKHSVVVPCYHERDNIRPLVTRVFAALRDPRTAEIVLVDDNSRDGTAEEAAALRTEGHNVVLIVRTDGKGLSSAVVRGFEEARGQSLVVMDADLQVRVSRRFCWDQVFTSDVVCSTHRRTCKSYSTHWITQKPQ
jgi:dolichol-phosphate mannosyltransferase